MLPKTYLKQLLLPRLAEATARMEKQIWAPHGGPYPVRQAPPTAEHRNIDAVSVSDYTQVETHSHIWGNRYDQCWWQLPEELITASSKQAGELYLDWRDEGEATLYADGVPWHGIDPAHQIIPLPKNARDLKVESVCVRTGIWIPGRHKPLSTDGSHFKGAYTVMRNESAWRAWVFLDLMKEFIDYEICKQYPDHSSSRGSAGFRPALDRLDPLVRRLAGKMDEAIDVLDTDGEEAFNAAAGNLLKDFRASDRQTMKCILTGHAHIDLVWLWPERVGDFKAVHTFSTVNRLMERYPEFTFGYSQPASYEAVARRTPRLLDESRKHIASGRWEAEGATYVESDTQLACGENLVRSFLLGQKGFASLTGKASTTLWLPDVFGYSGCIPQIMAQTGTTRFFTTKLTWCSVSRFPHSSFRWLGYDGTEVIVHVTQAYGYNGQVGIKEIDDGQLHYQQADVHDAYLAPTGWGDGGGGPTEVMCERARILKDFAGTPHVKWGRIDEFFESLEAVRSQLPAFQGELYLEYHRGVQTTHGDLKAAFRAAERGLQVWEAAHCACRKGSIDKAPWKRLVFAQFHDYIPGSSVKEVYDEAIPELQAIAESGITEAASILTGELEKGSPSIFNPLPVAVPVFEKESGIWKTLGPLSGNALDALPLIPAQGPVNSSTNRISNDRVVAEFDTAGRITSLKIDNVDIPFTGPAGELVTYPDHPHAYDAWDIDRSALSLPQAIATPAEVNIQQADDGHAGSVSFTRRFAKASSISTHYRLEGPDSCLRIEFDVDLQDPDILLKAVFPTDYCGRHARYGAPFGSSLRIQQPARPDDEAQFENPFSRWIEVSDDAGYNGCFVVTESKYGATVFQGSVQVSLLRSVFTSDMDLVKKPEKLLDPSSYSDIGQHSIHLAIGRVSPDSPREQRPATLADTLFTKPLSYNGYPVDAGLIGIEGLPSLHPCWAKPAEKGNGAWVLRCNETHGQRGMIKLRLKEGYTATAVDLMEKLLDVQPDTQGNYPIRPYALISFLIEPDSIA